MWLEAIILGLLIGWLRGGRLANLEKLKIKGGFLIALALIFQLLPFFLSKLPFIEKNAALFGFAGALLTSLVLLFNIKIKGMPLVILGSWLNVIVLFFNEYKMPIDLTTQTNSARMAELKLNITNGNIANYTLFANTEHWSKYFGKIFILPPYYPFTSFVGLPDLIIAIGLIYLIQSEMQNNTTSYHGFNGYYL